MYNPFYIYILAFSIVIFMTLWNWSNLVPLIGISLLIFFLSTFIISFFIGIFLQSKNMFKYHDINFIKNNRKKYVLLFIWMSYLIEGVYMNGFPLFSLFGFGGGRYVDFGIPVFHVFLVTFHSFFITYYFHSILSKNKIKFIDIFYLILLILPATFIVNRAMLLVILLNMIFLYLIKNIKVSNISRFRKFLPILVLLLIVLYLFGLMGNMRSNIHFTGLDKVTNTSYILEVGEATEAFKDSFIPEPFFWGYIYATSPIANLQYNIENADLKLDGMAFIDFINFSILPDFINKRIAALYGLEDSSVQLITPHLNVTTAFGGISSQLGMLGMFLFYIIVFSIIVVYLVFLKKSKYYLTSLVTINTMVLLFTFSNMWVFSGVSFQLIYPIIFTIIGKLKL